MQGQNRIPRRGLIDGKKQFNGLRCDEHKNSKILLFSEIDSMNLKGIVWDEVKHWENLMNENLIVFVLKKDAQPPSDLPANFRKLMLPR